EDRRFWRHLGISPRGIASAVRINMREGRGPLEGHGGSTITQQVAKLLCLGVVYGEASWENEAAYEEGFVAPLLAMYGEPDERRRPLLSKKNYEEVRALFAQEFARQHDRRIRAGLGEKADEILAWLGERTELRETLFNAFGPSDDVAAGMDVFRRLYDEFGEDLEAYGALATAASVVWDDPNRGPYSYDHHAKRAKASLPVEERPDAVENVRYFIDREPLMQGRAQLLPWEWLTLTIDHRTPIEERDWALGNYGNVRSDFGQCYAQVPYDNEMLRTESRSAALNGSPYTLPEILEHGGVCAHQADYASRVGKSLGVPAMEVTGDGKFGGAGHAWVMWVDVTGVTDSALKFTLKDHGRYQGDNYYVGDLNDPQTGRRSTDRELMRRLHAIATDRFAARHAKLLMRSYPILAKRARSEEKRSRRNEPEADDATAPTGLNLEDRFDYLDGVNELDPWNAEAWRERARLANKNADSLTKAQVRRLKKDLDRLFRDFAPFPDFTAEVFTELSSYEKDEKKRLALQKQLLDLYASAKRPDLSFGMLPEYIDALVAQERTEEAIQTMFAAIMNYADEGLYVPDALDRLSQFEAVTPEMLANFYYEFVQEIPPTRGNDPSEYAVAMHKRGVEIAEEANRDDLAAFFTERMRAIGEGKLKSRD
ncbi:MAG: transglycosylase domain-containing protein, partial [Planctomycetota bacterium]